MVTHKIEFAAHGETYYACTACVTLAVTHDAGAVASPLAAECMATRMQCELHYEGVCDNA